MPYTPTMRRITITEVVKSFDVWRLLTGFDGPTVRRRLRAVVNDAERRHRGGRTGRAWRLKRSSW